LSISCQTACRNQVVNVWVIGQVAAPGMQDTHQANLSANKTGVFCQALGSRGRNSEEQVVQQALSV